MIRLIRSRSANLREYWAELVTFIFLIIGTLLSLMSDSAVVTYVIIFICGIVVGRNAHVRRRGLTMPFYLIVIGFIVGYIIGATAQNRGNPIIILICFAVGIYAGHYLHKNRYIQ